MADFRYLKNKPSNSGKVEKNGKKKKEKQQARIV